MTDADARPTAGGGERGDLRSHLESCLCDALDCRGADAAVAVGDCHEPCIRYCLSALEPTLDAGRGPVAVAFDGDDWLLETTADASSHPAEAVASRLADRFGSGTVLTPADVPHDAALYLEGAGLELASTAVLERARTTKTVAERDRIADAQRAGAAGIRRGAAVLAGATVEDGRLVADGEAVTAGRLRRTVDEGIVAAGAFPAGTTVVDVPAGRVDSSATDDGDDPLSPGEPIVLETAPRGPAGYHGGLVRTLVVDGDGGRDRRAHVGATQSFRSAAAMLTAGTESVTAVEADLEAEVRAFGFEESAAVRTRVTGVGLEARERPLSGGDAIDPGSVVRLEVAVRVGDGWLRLADLLERREADERARYLSAPSRSLEPAALCEE